MDAHTLFEMSGPVALFGWLALVLSPLHRIGAQWVAGILIPAFLGLAYGALILTNWAEAPGGFGSLDDVMLLFTVPGVALAGWLHYLAFDLFVGAWEVRTAQREGISHWLVLPCLLLTFLFGPIGFVLFLGVRLAHRMTYAKVHHAG